MIPIAFTLDCTEAEGPGRRFALWVQGCPFRCPGCCNPEFLDFDAPASPTTTGALMRTIDRLGDRVEGISLLGGEPFAFAPELSEVAAFAKRNGKTVMAYSGFTRAEIEGDEDRRRLLAHCDVLVDGRYQQGLRTTTTRFVGSRNQVLHFLTDAYDKSDPRFAEANTIELRMRGHELILNGFPVLGAKTRV